MKKKSFLSIVFMLALLLNAGSSFAAGWSQTTSVTTIFLHSGAYGTGAVYLVFADMINPDGCTNSNLIVFPIENNLFKEIYAALLAMYTTGGSVEYRVNGCASDGYPKMDNMKAV